MDGPNDPVPGLVVEEGKVVELDGTQAHRFDLIDRFIIDYGLDLEVAAEAMGMDDHAIARMLVDVGVSRSDLVRLAGGLTPAKLASVDSQLDAVEMMLALKK